MANWILYVIGSFIAGTLLLVGVGSRYWLGPDNEIEEVVEIITFDTIGKDIDLSPDTPDPDDLSLSIDLFEEDYPLPDEPSETKTHKEKIDENFG